jgi:hypothetical protein
MNCLEFRRVVGADPARQGAELEQHARACTACAEFARQMRLLDQKIAAALRVPVPTQTPRSPSVMQAAPAQKRWALAASVLLAVVVASFVWLSFPRATLASDVVAHARHEPESWAPAVTDVPSSAIADLLRGSSVAAEPQLGRVSYAHSCWFRGHFVPHLVVQDEGGPVMVLVMTEETVNGRVAFTEQGYSGVLLPARRGSIAVLAPEGARVDAVAARVMQALR